MRNLTVAALAVSTFIVIGPLFAEAQGDAKAGKDKYGKFCVVCHGTSGKGDGLAGKTLDPKPTDHTNGEYMNTLTDDHLFNVIKQGGKALGRSELMPPWGPMLNDKEIQDVVAYIRTLVVPPHDSSKK